MKKWVLLGCVLLLGAGVYLRLRSAAAEYTPPPVRLMTWWNVHGHPASPFEAGVSPVPQEVLSSLRQANQRDGFTELPRVPNPDPSFDADVHAALRTLPDAVKRQAAPWLMGLFVVEELGGSAFTQSILNEKKQPVSAYVVVDRHALDKPANPWATWKERSPFVQDPSLQLHAVIEDDANNTRVQTIQYILLHELGHVLALELQPHPPWDVAPRDVGLTGRYAFYSLSWTVADEKYQSLFEDVFPLRPKVRFYAGPQQQLPASDAATVYQQWEKTNFPSLYAATKPGDDFAESFVTYVHTVMMQRPWRVELQGHTYATCWGQPRCAAKQAQLQALLFPTVSAGTAAP